MKSGERTSMDSETRFSPAKRGCLLQEVSFFNLSDNKKLQIESHYHDFHKVIIFLSGKVTYCVEGIAYPLKPWDVVLVHQDSVHNPVIDPALPYRRMVLWLKPSFLQSGGVAGDDLLTCFSLAQQNKNHVLRMTQDMLPVIKGLVGQIDETCGNRQFGDTILRNALLLQLLVHINRLMLSRQDGITPAGVQQDESISEVLRHIDKHLAEDLSVEKLAAEFFLSKYHFMRKFKQHTGYSVHSYVLQKRLISAGRLIREGNPVMLACLESGFSDYSNFTRSFKKVYGLSPRKYQGLAQQNNTLLPEQGALQLQDGNDAKQYDEHS